MNFLRFSGCSTDDTCSADTVVPRITKRSTPAATTVSYSSCVRCGVRAPATVTPAGADLGEPVAHELGLDRLGVQLLHAPGRRGLLERGDLGEQRLGVVVARPEALEVEHAEAAELAEHDRRPRAHDRVHRRAEHRDRELERVDRPRGRDVLGIARAPRRHDRDVVERIRATRALGAAELDLHAHGISLPGCVLRAGCRGSRRETAVRTDAPAKIETDERTRALRRRSAAE